jgi:hypothetical protein
VEQTLQYSPEDRTGQWLLNFTASLVACFSRTIGLLAGWRGQCKLVAFSIKFPMPASLNCLWVILLLHEVRWRKLFSELSRPASEKIISLSTSVSGIVSCSCWPFCPLCLHTPYVGHSPIWFLALWHFYARHRSYCLLVGCAYLSVCVCHIYPPQTIAIISCPRMNITWFQLFVSW